MKIKCKKTLISMIAILCIPHLTQAIDWNAWVSIDSWKTWGNSLVNGKNASGSKDEQEDSDEEVINLDVSQTVKDSKDASEPKVDFYDTLKIKFFPEQYLLGDDATLKKHLTTLFEKKENRSAISYFISIERKNHALGIAMLESMKPAHRLVILLQSPAQFITKLLVDMRKSDFKGKTLSHWGTYELKSEYFGKKVVDNAEIKGESVSLRYIIYILFHNASSKNEFNKRAGRLAEILSFASAEDLASLLVYTREEATVKMGQKHADCFGALKSKGYCDEATVIYLPTDFVGNLLNFMHTNNMISSKDLVTIFETEFKINQDRFQDILKRIDLTVIQEIIPNFSDEVHPFLPDDIILSGIPLIEEIETILSITSESNSSSDIISALNKSNTTSNSSL